MNFIKDKRRARELLIISIVLLATIALVVATYTLFTPKVSSLADEELMDTQELVIAQNEGPEVPMLASARSASSESNKVDERIVEEKREILSSLPDAYSAIVLDFEKLKAGDSETVTRYFGESEVFTPETVADRVYGTTVNFISQEADPESDTTAVVLHICTIDYPSMNGDFISAEETQLAQYKLDQEGGTLGDKTEADYKETAKKEVTRNLIDGKYKVCYNIPITVDNTTSTPIVNETFKQAITGSWYTGPGNTSQLNPVECLVGTSQVEPEPTPAEQEPAQEPTPEPAPSEAGT